MIARWLRATFDYNPTFPILLHLAWDHAPGAEILALAGAALGLAGALRPCGDLAPRAALALVAVACAHDAVAPACDASVAIVAGSAVSLAIVTARRRARAATALSAALLVGARRALRGADPGAVLVVLSFAAIAAGTAIALRRERARAVA